MNISFHKSLPENNLDKYCDLYTSIQGALKKMNSKFKI